MGKIWVEVCLISARGLPCSTSLWKRGWFAVGWVDLNNKYCTKVDSPGNANPVWRSKFAIPVDDSEPSFQCLTLNVEVYSRDPIFLTEKLHGSATVVLKEFLAKLGKNSEVSKPGHEEVGSYQLRKKKSSKPRGFIDISIRVYEEKEEEPNSHPGNEGGILLLDRGYNTHSTTEDGLGQAYAQQQPQVSFHRPETHVQTNFPYSHPMPFPTATTSYPIAAVPSHQPPRIKTPPPPAPPSNVGYIPTLLPRNDDLPPSYINMPSSSSRAAPSRGGPPGFAIGAGAGALAAGAVIFGDDFMSGFNAPPGLGDASLTIETDPFF